MYSQQDKLKFCQALTRYIEPADGIEFVPMKPEHVRDIALHQTDMLIMSQYMDVQAQLVHQAKTGMAVAVTLSGTPVAVFGFNEVWSGVAEAWSLIQNDARKHPIKLTGYARLVFDIAAISLRLHRVQITVRNSDRRAMRWAGALGFEAEGTLRKYGPDEGDYTMFARTT